MMPGIAFALSVYAVPVVPGPYAQQPGGELERLARMGEVPPAYLPPPPRGQGRPWDPLCACGVRGCVRHR